MDRKVTVKEYPSEMAGERVGWVSVQEPEGREDIVSVGLATATVGREGASYGYRILDRGESELSIADDEGFIAATSLFMIINKEGRTDPSGQFYFSSRRDGAKTDSLMHMDFGYHDLTPKDTDRQWYDNTHRLLGQLKSGLSERGLSDNYPDVYYALNMNIGADKNLGHNVVERSQLMLPDPEMAETTTKEMAKSLRVANLIKDVIDIDELMAQELTVFSSLQADQVPEIFSNTRRMVAAKESEVRQIVSGLRSRLYVYKPIGFRPNGRSWPYMDPEESDDFKAFGFVLEDLKRKRVGIANYELNREIGEANKRLDHAMNGVGMLGSLAVVERESAQTKIGSC